MPTVIKVFDRGVAVGDALFLDNNSPKRKVFLRYSELDNVPSGYTFVGVVFNVTRGVAKILNKTAVSAQYKTSNTADGTAESWYYKKTGATTNYRGIMNVARGVAYWASNGRTPTADVPIVLNGNDNPVSQAAFESNGYCKLLRQTYANYESYIRDNFGILYPQGSGCFGLSDGKTITYAYNNSEHPAFQHCAGVTYSVDGLAAGDWFLPGVAEGVELMRDDTLAKVAATMSKMSGSVPNNSTYRWFAQRFDSTYAWFFNGNSGDLYGNGCTYSNTVQAVALLEI